VSVLCPAGVKSKLNEAERNRPARWQNPPETRPLTPDQENLYRIFREMNETAMSPARYAEMVFRGIERDQLFVLTHPEMSPRIRQRCDDIINQRNPVDVGFE
jgi:hypothetical protein